MKVPHPRKVTLQVLTERESVLVDKVEAVKKAFQYMTPEEMDSSYNGTNQTRNQFQESVKLDLRNVKRAIDWANQIGRS